MAAPQLLKTKQYNQELFLDSSNSLLSLTISWLKDFLHWWYISMPVWYVLSMRRILTVINDQYSITLLISNFFVPWHRDTSFVGYLIGFVMKILFLPIGIFVFVCTFFVYILFLIIWILIPLVTILGIFLTPFLNL